MFTLHIDTIGHYQCKPQPGWDVLHSSFWSTEVSTVPVLCILGATPTGQKTCVHIHGQFPYLLVPVSRAKADESYLQVFAACLEDAINAAASSNSTNSHHVFSISLLSRRLKTECRELQQCIKVSFYDPDIVPKAAHLLQNGAVMNTHFQPWGADLPFFLQLIIDHHLHDASHLHFSAFKVRSLSKRHDDEAQHVCSLTEGDVCRSANEFASVQWRSFSDVLCVISLSQWNTSTPANTTPGCDVDNMPSERLPVACLKPLNLELEVDVKAADIIHSHQLCGDESGEWSAIDNLLRVVEESSSPRFLCCAACRRDHPGTTEAVATFSSCPENPHDISDKQQSAAFGFDSDDDDCAMDDSDCDDDRQYEEEEDDDDSDGDIPQFDGTSDEKTATKKPSRKRASAKNSKLGTGSGGSGREDSSSQGEGSNPSCSPQVQSPVMVPGGEMSFPREQGVMSPYRHHQGSFPYQGGYYRQQWGESSMAPGMTAMSPYPGYHPSSAGWGHSTPPHSAYPFMHRFPGNSFGYYPYPRHHPYSPAFRQSATPSSRQQANFSPPVSSPMSPPSFSSSGPTVQAHSSSASQQYAHFMSPQGAAVQRQSDGSVAQQDRLFSSSSEWQYPHPAFHNWGFAQSTSGGPAHGMPWGPAQRMPTAPGQSMPSVSGQNVPSASGQSMPSATALNMSVPSSSATGQSMPSAPGQSMPSAPGQSMPSAPGQSMPSGSALPPATVPSISSGSALSSGSVHTSLPSVSAALSMSGSAVPSGSAHSMPPDSTLPSVTAHSMSLASAVPAGQIQSMSSGSVVSSDTVQNVSSGSAVSGAVQNIPSRSTLPSEPAQSVSLQPAVSSENSLSVSAESTLSGLAESISLESTQSKPPELFQNTFSESSKPIPVRSEQSMSPQSVQSLSSESGQSVPSKPVENNASETVHSVPSGPVPSTSAMSNQGVSQEQTLHSAQAVGLESTKDVPSSRSVSDTSVTPVSNMPLKSYEGMPSGPAETVSSGISLDMHASAESPSSQSVGSTVSESSSVPVVSQVGEAVASSSGYIAGKPPDASYSVPFCSTSESSPSITPASSQYAVTSVAASGSLNSSADSPFETSATTSASGPLASCQNKVTGSGEEKPADSSSSHAVSLPSSSDVSFQSSVAPSGYTLSGSCPSVSSRSPHAAPAGPYRDMASNWWGSPFPGGPRPMQNSVTSPVGQNQFRPMHSETMAGQRPYGPARNNFQTAGGFNQSSAMLNNQTPPGQRQPSPMSSAQNPSGPAQLCGMQNAWDSTAHGQPFPVQQSTQNLTGPRYPGPAQNIHNPVGQRYPGPASSMHSHFAQRHRIPAQSMHMPAGQRQPGPVQESSYDPMEQSQNTSDSFSLDSNRRQSQVLAGPSQTQANSLPCDRSQWQDCRKAPSTLQDLLSAPDSSAAKPSSHGPSSVNFPRRAMSMDCSPSDFYTSPTRGSDSGEAVRQEFKQPQRRSGSFGSPLGFSGGGGGAPSALSNLFNFVSNVDPMARTPTPTSRNSTPSSTPHSDPSPNLTYRADEDCGAVEVGLPPAKWQPHLSSPPAPPLPQGASVDEGFGGQAKHVPPVASPVLGGNAASSNPSMSREQVWDNKPQMKQQTEVSEEYKVGCKVEKRADTEVVMCNKEVSCDNMDIPVLAMYCKGTKKETGAGGRAASKGKKDSGGGAVSSSTSSAASGRVGKQNRMKKLGGNMTRGRRMSDDRVKSPPAIPFPCPAYTFTFHVPTPVYKRFKMHAIFPDKPAHHVKLVRMHPMDARRYSLLKIGRELVRIKRLSPQDLRTKREASPASCTDDTASYTDDHNSLIDPHTGELMRPFPAVLGGVQTGLQSLRYKNGTEQSGHLLDPGHCMVPKMLTEGSCQTSPRSMNRMGRLDGEQKMHRLSPGPVGIPTSLSYNIQNDMGDSNSGQSWQTLDRDRRPSVKVEYPAQRGSNGSEQWPGGHSASQSWTGGSWGYNNSGSVQWGENWQNTNQPPAWGPNHGGQPYNYGPWMGGGGGFHHPGASNMYPYNTWSPSGHSFTSQPSMSTAHSQTATTGSSSTSQGSMGTMAQGQVYHQGYPHGGSGMYNQQAAFPSSSHPNNAGGKFAPHGGSSMGAEHFPYHGTPSAQNYSHGMGHNPYHANYSASGYQPTGGNRKVMCQPGFGVGQQQQQQQQQQSVGGMTGLPQENQQFRQCGNPSTFEPGGGYSASGPAPSMPSAPPHGPGPGPGPGPSLGSAQFSGQSAQVPPTQQGPFMPASQQPGHFFQPNQLSHQSGQFPSHTQASRVPPQADQAVFSPTDQQGHSGNQLCSPSETSSQDGPCQTSKAQDLSSEREKQQEQFSKAPGAQDHQENKSESDSGCPEVGDSSVGSHDLHTPEHKSFLQKAACQALTTVCEASLPSAQNSQSDRPETDISENSTDTIELNTIVQNTISRGYTQHTESKCIIFDDSIESATLQNIEDECEMPNQNKSTSNCALQGGRSSNSFQDNQQQRTAVTSCSRQNLRRSSVQLWSDGDSDSVEDNSDEESSDDYQPSSKRRRKKRKRKRSRHQSRAETKRTKRSSVNYSAHAFSKYLDHDFEKRSSQRLRQSRKSKRKKRRRKGNSLVEGVHYIVVGKFKGHRLMLVKLNKVKVKVDERIRVSDWSRTGGKRQVTTPCRLQGPRCRRIAKGTPPDDPCFVQPGDSADSDSEEEDCAESALEEKSVTATPACNSNNEAEPAVDVKVEDSCDVKQAIKQETHETPVHVPVNEGDVPQTQPDSFVKSEHSEDSTKGSGDLTESRSVDASSDKTDVEAAVSPQEGELVHQVECSDSGIEHEDSAETGNNADGKPCSVKTELDATSAVETSEKVEQQDDTVETQSPGDAHIQSTSCLGAEVLEEDGEDTVDFSNSTCAHTDDRSCDAESALGGQSPVLLSESGGEPVKTMPTAVSLSLLEGKTC